ncbi:hypothetical protein BH11PSE7_BH11PSE7_17420 [soil metagenome]
MTPCRVALGLLLAAATASTMAATYRVDDSRSVTGQAVTQMRWRTFVPGRAADSTVQAQLPVALSLNLQQWVGRPGRIYMALAPAPGPVILAQWQTQGRLLGGSVRSGGRSLVYEGVITQPLLQENMSLSLSTDGQALTSLQTLQFYFEIDVAP